MEVKCPECGETDVSYVYEITDSRKPAGINDDLYVCTKCDVRFTPWQQSKIEALDNQISSLKALMREKEWSGLYNSFGVATCLFCENDRIEGHKPDCRIAKALEE